MRWKFLSFLIHFFACLLLAFSRTERMEGGNRKKSFLIQFSLWKKKNCSWWNHRMCYEFEKRDSFFPFNTHAIRTYRLIHCDILFDSGDIAVSIVKTIFTFFLIFFAFSSCSHLHRLLSSMSSVSNEWIEMFFELELPWSVRSEASRQKYQISSFLSTIQLVAKRHCVWDCECVILSYRQPFISFVLLQLDCWVIDRIFRRFNMVCLYTDCYCLMCKVVNSIKVLSNYFLYFIEYFLFWGW